MGNLFTTKFSDLKEAKPQKAKPQKAKPQISTYCPLTVEEYNAIAKELLRKG